jgi:hypothetical protein
VPLALPELIWLALLLFSFAVVYSLRKFIEAMFSTLISILNGLHLGGVFGGVLTATEQAVSNALGSAEAGIDKAIGASFHALSRLTDWLWREFKSHSLIASLLAAFVAELARAFHGVRSVVHDVAKAAHGVGGRVKALEKEYHGIEHELHHLEHEISKGIGDDVLPRIKSLEKGLTHVENKVIPDIRSIAQTAENDVAALRKWVTDNIPLIGTSVFAGAVAVALGALGLGGLRCNTLLNSLKNRGCGLWSGLEDLLGLFVDTLLLTNVCTILPFLETAVSDVADPIVIALTDVGAGLCSGGIGAAPALQVPALSLPASPGFSLQLP